MKPHWAIVLMSAFAAFRSVKSYEYIGFVPMPVLEMRMTDGISYGEGKLQVFHDEEWGTVCNTKFRHEEATVACRQMGFQSGIRIVPRGPIAGTMGIDDKIWLDSIDCEGDETRLDACPHAEWGVIAECDHKRDVWIKCHDYNLLVTNAKNGVSDAAITASSEEHTWHTGTEPGYICRAPRGRLNAEVYQHGSTSSNNLHAMSWWANINSVEDGEEQWIQVDLSEPKLVCGVLTRGGYVETFLTLEGLMWEWERSSQWVTEFNLQHSQDGVEWITVQESGVDKVFTANFDPFTVVSNPLDVSISARFFRIKVVDYFDLIPRFRVRMSFDLFGC